MLAARSRTATAPRDSGSSSCALPARAAAPLRLRRAAAAPGGRRRLTVAATATPPTRQQQEARPAAPQPPPPQPQPEPAEPLELAWPKPRGWAEVALGKLLDTAEDVAVIARRTLKDSLPGAEVIDRLFRRESSGALKLVARKPVVLVLGTGWGAHSLIKVIDVDAYEVVVVSPRNHFLFTPMLPSTAVGTVEFRSLLEPIRTSNPFATYLEASCERLDPEAKVAYCTAAVSFEDGRRPSFEIPYDIAVVAVGEAPATFGVPGVSEHCHFMKEVSDTVRLRTRIQEAFELAALPGTSEADRRAVLHFVVVGGGPTGVEFAGTLSDFVRVDLARKYPELMPFVRVSLLQSADSILTQFSGSLQERALANFQASGVEVRLAVRVTGVTRDVIRLRAAGGAEEELRYGICVWSTGNAARPLTQALVASVPRQAALQGGAAAPRGRGQQGAYAARLINRGYSLGLGGLDTAPPVRVDPAHAVGVDVEAARRLRRVDAAAIAAKPAMTELDVLALTTGDSTYAAPPGVSYYRKPFEFLSLGIMAYVGNDKALTQVEAFDGSLDLYGSLAFLLWRSVYITKQVSFRNRVLILFDWMKARVFGRDLSQF
ncbi:SPAC3A11.07 [Scenedesmus sp. PABB004]|nr:SPAC3A11.07 [Scenedesmus sp. PABB004]